MAFANYSVTKLRKLQNWSYYAILFSKIFSWSALFKVCYMSFTLLLFLIAPSTFIYRPNMSLYYYFIAFNNIIYLFALLFSLFLPSFLLIFHLKNQDKSFSRILISIVITEVLAVFLFFAEMVFLVSFGLYQPLGITLTAASVSLVNKMPQLVSGFIGHILLWLAFGLVFFFLVKAGNFNLRNYEHELNQRDTHFLSTIGANLILRYVLNQMFTIPESLYEKLTDSLILATLEENFEEIQQLCNANNLNVPSKAILMNIGFEKSSIIREKLTNALKNNKLDEMLKEWKVYIENKKEEMEPFFKSEFNKGNDYFDQKNYSSALQAFENALFINSNNSEAWNNKSIALQHQYRYREALIAANQALKINPNFYPAWISKSASLLGMLNARHAFSAIMRAHQLKPDSDQVYSQAAHAFLLSGKYQAALQATDYSLQLNPNSIDAMIFKSVALRSINKLQDGLEVIDQSLQIDPSKPMSWSTKGVSLAVLDKLEEGLDAINHALELNPTFLGGWISKSFVLRISKKYKEAIDATNSALQIEYFSSPAWYNKSLSLWKLGKRKEGIKAFLKFIWFFNLKKVTKKQIAQFWAVTPILQ